MPSSWQVEQQQVVTAAESVDSSGRVQCDWCHDTGQFWWHMCICTGRHGESVEGLEADKPWGGLPLGPHKIALLLCIMLMHLSYIAHWGMCPLGSCSNALSFECLLH